MLRKKYIDIAKFIGIALVVLGHNAALQEANDSYLYNLIYAFHVPLFFFLSGCFISEKKGLKEQLFSKFDSLLKPYIVISVLLVTKTLLENSLTINYMTGLLYGNGLTIEWVPMWFLTHLFIASLISYAILRMVFSHITINFLKLAFILGMLYFGVFYIKAFWLGDALFFRDSNLYGLPFSSDILLVTVPYLLLGNIYRKSVLGMKTNHVLGVLSIFSVLTLSFLFNDKVDLNLRNYDGFITVNLKILCSIYAVLYLSLVLSKINLVNIAFAYSGKASMFILIFHFYIQAKSYNILKDRFGLDTSAEVISFFLGMTLPILMYWLVTNNKVAATIMLPMNTKKSIQ